VIANLGKKGRVYEIQALEGRHSFVSGLKMQLIKATNSKLLSLMIHQRWRLDSNYDSCVALPGLFHVENIL